MQSPTRYLINQQTQKRPRKSHFLMALTNLRPKWNLRPICQLCRMSLLPHLNERPIRPDTPTPLHNRPETPGHIGQSRHRLSRSSSATDLCSGPRLATLASNRAGYVVWEVVDFGNGMSVLDARWVYTQKPTGWKARWVAKGIKQIKGLHYD